MRGPWIVWVGLLALAAWSVVLGLFVAWVGTDALDTLLHWGTS